MSLKVLITTIQPVDGGVPQMLRFVVECLQARGYEITIAHYLPYSVEASLSTPFHRLLRNKPGIMQGDDFTGVKTIGVGCWLPELEFTHYWLSKRWQALIDEHDVYLSVSGTCLASLPFVQANVPFMAWVATDWQGDRVDRVDQFPWYRKFLDMALNAPVIRLLEKKIIKRGHILALSAYTKKSLNALVKHHDSVQDTFVMPVDTQLFSSHSKEATKKIGFVGRFADPRKNIELLLSSFAKVQKQNSGTELLLIGDKCTSQITDLIEFYDIKEHVQIIQYVANDELPAVLKNLDVFVVPSYQEGLCIAALEAMSCSVPVISTRCGGPENYIQPGVNGELVPFDVDEMVSALNRLMSNPDLLNQYSCQARQTVERSYARALLEPRFYRLLDDHLETRND